MSVVHATSVRNRTHQPKPVASQYGLLVVQEHVPGMGWRCVCACGTAKFVDGNHLRSGRVNSCGCNAKKAQAEKIRGRKQGHRVKTAPVRNFKVYKSGVRCWVCRTFTGVMSTTTQTEIVLCKRCESGAP